MKYESLCTKYITIILNRINWPILKGKCKNTQSKDRFNLKYDNFDPIKLIHRNLN